MGKQKKGQVKYIKAKEQKAITFREKGLLNELRVMNECCHGRQARHDSPLFLHSSLLEGLKEESLTFNPDGFIFIIHYSLISVTYDKVFLPRLLTGRQASYEAYLIILSFSFFNSACY